MIYQELKQAKKFLKFKVVYNFAKKWDKPPPGSDAYEPHSSGFPSAFIFIRSLYYIISIHVRMNI